MVKIRVTSQFKVEGVSDLDQESDDLFDAINKVEKDDGRLSQADVSATLEQGLIRLSLVVRAENWESARQIGTDAMTLAIERVGGTVEIPDDYEEVTLDEHVSGAAGFTYPPESIVRLSAHLKASIQSVELVPA